MKKEAHEQTVISWKAPEFHHYKKGTWWFPLLAVGTLALATLFTLTNQYLVAIIIVLGAIVLYRLAHAEPEVLSVNFSHRGVKFKGIFYPFSSLKTFWIIDTGEHKRLHLQQIERFRFPIVVPLVKQDVEKIRDFLRHYLPETQEAEEDLADRLNRWLKI